MAAGWNSPTSVVRAQPEDVLESLSGLNGPQKAFVRRAVDKVNEMDQKAKALENAVVHSSESVVPFASQGSVEHSQSMHSLLGNETSALAVAEALAAGRDTLDVAMVLREAKLENVTDSFCSSKDVFAALVTAQKAAEKLGKPVFTYVELTHASVLPEFLPPEAVGAKTTLPGQDEVLAGYTGTISQLSATLKAITTAPRFFRNLTQWTTAFTRYAVVAVASKQISWEWVFIHMKVVKRVALEYNPMIAILYDELKR